MRHRGLLLAFLCVLSLGPACATTWQARFLQTGEIQDLDFDAPFVKCHKADGDLIVLADWSVNLDRQVIEGTGLAYGPLRNQPQRRGHFTVPFAEIALLETNQPESFRRTDLIVLGIVTTGSLLVTAVCLANPKACFGSCPTFYGPTSDGEGLQAEAFSDSVARNLEATDIDALFNVEALGPELSLVMRNEAFETHLVNSVHLLAVPRSPNGRVFHSEGQFYPAERIQSASSCRSEEGDCLTLVQSADDREYLSLTDGQDLARREVLELTFPPVEGQAGVVVRGRNSLLTTFLFYQALAYMGSTTVDWILRFEASGAPGIAAVSQVGHLLGQVDVEVLDATVGWVSIGAFFEVGPIAREVQVIPVPSGLILGDPIQVRFTMTRGNWKLDWLAVAQIGLPVEARQIAPIRVERDGQSDDEALQQLLDPEGYVVGYPGDALSLIFPLPEGPLELFLESRGYYYEWVRQAWLPEEDLEALQRMILDPAMALRALAPTYRQLEPEIERIFWESRVGSPP